MSRLILRKPQAVVTAPSWFTSMGTKEWTQLADQADFTAVAQLPEPTMGNGSGISIIVGNFCGGCIDHVRRELLLVANGGHSDYCGNEGYAFAFGLEVPTWYRLTNRTPDGSIIYETSGSGLGNVRVQYADGLCRAMHTWNVPVFHDGKVWFAYETDYSRGNSGNTSAAWSFSRDACGDNYGAFPIAYATVAANGGDGPGFWQYLGLKRSEEPQESSLGCYDHVNNRIIGIDPTPGDSVPAGLDDETVWTINPTNPTGSPEHFNVKPISGNPTLNWACATKTTPGIVVCGATSGELYVWDLSNRSGTKLTARTVSGSSGWDGTYGWYGVWHEPSNAILMYNMRVMGGSKTVVKLSMDNTSDPFNSSWTASNISGAAGGVTPPAAAVNSYSKFNLIPDMGNGQGCLVVADYAQGVYAYKLPSGALT